MEMNLDQAAENTGGGDFVKEDKFIPAGDHPMILREILELGEHTPQFKNMDATYTSGPRKGEVKDPEFVFRFIWEASCCEYTNAPLTIGAGPIDALGLPAYAHKDTSKITNKMRFFKYINNVVRVVGHPGGKFKIQDLLGARAKLTITNALAVAKQKELPGYMYANHKYMDIFPTAVYSSSDPTKILEDIGSMLPDECIGETLYFSWDNPDPEVFKKLTPWFRNDIRTALNLNGSAVERMFNTNPDLWSMDDKKDKEKKPVSETDGPATPVQPPVAPPVPQTVPVQPAQETPQAPVAQASFTPPALPTF